MKHKIDNGQNPFSKSVSFFPYYQYNLKFQCSKTLSFVMLFTSIIFREGSLKILNIPQIIQTNEYLCFI